MNAPEESTKTELTSEELISRLKRALGKDGDFPASAKVVSELRQLASDPNATAQQITEVILREPSLGARVLNVVNSTAYNRGAPIMTVSQAVMRLGMKQLAELCAGLVLLQKFVPTSRRGGSFATCLKRMLVSSLLSSSLGKAIAKEANGGAPSPNKGKGECGYLAGMLAEMGVLLLAFYFPNVYENALKRAENKRLSLEQSIFEITGHTPVQLSVEALESLSLPPFYVEVLKATAGEKVAQSELTYAEQGELDLTTKSLQAAMAISSALCSDSGKENVDKAIAQVIKTTGVSDAIVGQLIGELSETFKDHCSLLEVDLPELPSYISQYKDPKSSTGITATKEEDGFQRFITEIRQSVDNREPTATVLTTVMESLAWGLNFDRVVLLLVTPTRDALVGRMALGNLDAVDPKKISRPIGPSASIKACDVAAYREARPVFQGTPVLEGGWPFAALPIGSKNKAVGVIYADRAKSKDLELNPKEKAALGVLVDLLNRSVTTQ